MKNIATVSAVLGAIAALLPAAASAEGRLSADVEIGAGMWDDVAPVDRSHHIMRLPTMQLGGRLGMFADHVTAGAALTTSLGLFVPSAATLGFEAGPAFTSAAGTRVELLASGGMQLHDQLGSEYAEGNESDTVILPYAGAAIRVWFPSGASSAMVGWYLAARTDIGRQAATATITPTCFCILGNPPPPFQASYNVGGPSFFGGLQVRFVPGSRPRPSSRFDQRATAQ